MFMRRQLKQGNLFHLGKSPNQEKQKLSSNRPNTVQAAETQQEFQQSELSFRQSQPPTLTDFNVDSLAAQNSVAVICCGALVCSLCLAIGFGLFYFVLFDYVKEYVPFITHKEDPLKFLTETNAKQYFAKNQMIAGQFQYPRVPMEYWSHRIQMIKSMGMNSLGVYVFWNYHEIQKGKFDFETKNKNLTYLLQLCKEHEMEVLLRPGPYVCAEWDWGGLPVRLMAVEGMQIRSSNQLFLAQTRIYFEQLHKVIKNYIRNAQNPHGPILMLQIQNQPGWFTKQLLYIQKIKEMWEQINVSCPFYFDDTKENLDNFTLYWDNAIIGMNAKQYNSSYYDFYANTSHFVFGGEVYSGWFSTWGGWEIWEVEYVDRYVDGYTKQFGQMLADKRSFSMYMPHGGTNFGLTAGFNYITSYDYYAPISEQGRATTNYHVFRSLAMNYTQNVPISIPAPIQTMSVTFGQLTPLSSLFDNMPSPISSQNYESLLFQSKELKMFNQGMVLYETKITGPKIYKFDTIIHDIGLIFVDGQYDQTVVRKKRKTKLDWEVHQITIQCKKQSCKLEILVEAMGHSNFGPQMNLDKKGIVRLIEKDTQQQLNFKWKHYKFDISTEPAWKNTKKCSKAPCLYYIQTDLNSTKDTYINVKDLRKGYIWVNGNNLGRYWEVGPQYSLYCPGVWLNKGKNKILVLDLYVENSTLTLKGQDSIAPIQITQPAELKK